MVLQVLLDTFNSEEFVNLVNQIKDITDKHKDRSCCMVVYSDGGRREYAGVGIHGYIHTDEIVKHKSKCANAYPTNKGYISKKVETELVNCVLFFDMCIALGDTTHNYAELFGALIVAELTKRLDCLSRVRLLSDSKYTVDGVTSHIHGWVKNGWRTSTGKDVANRELWNYWYDNYMDICSSKKPKLIIKWVKGHDGNAGNDIADSLATQGINMGISKITDRKVWLNCGEPEIYHDRVTNISPMLSERRLILNCIKGDTGYYFQMTMGGCWPSSEVERREQLGKRISDTCVSLVKLNEKDPIIERIDEVARQVGDVSNMLVCRLDLLSQGTLYHDLTQTDFATIDTRDNKMTTASGVEFVNELSQPRLSFRLTSVVDELALLLDVYNGDYDEGLTADKVFDLIDVTEQFFKIKQEKKGESYSFNDYNEEGILNISITPSFANGVETISLLGGVDLPSGISMKRLAKLKPKVTLLGWVMKANPRVMHYATIIQTEQGVGVWRSAYFGMYILKS